MQYKKYVRLFRGRPHTLPARSPSVEDWSLSAFGNTCRRAPIRPILGFWGAKSPKMGDSLPWTPMNHRAKI